MQTLCDRLEFAGLMVAFVGTAWLLLNELVLLLCDWLAGRDAQ